MSSDSDEDWFNKDLDKFVVDVQDKIENISINQENNNVGGPSNVYFDSGKHIYIYIFFFILQINVIIRY